MNTCRVSELNRQNINIYLSFDEIVRKTWWQNFLNIYRILFIEDILTFLGRNYRNALLIISIPYIYIIPYIKVINVYRYYKNDFL